MELSLPIERIRGVGSKTAEQLNLAGIKTIKDLIDFYPRAYEDFSNVVDIGSLKPGKVTIRANCEKVSTKFVRRGMKITSAVLSDKTGKVQAVWFNQPYREKQLSGGKEFFFSGLFEFSYNRYQLTNPSAELVSDMPVQTDRILPIYRSVKGIKSTLIRKLLDEVRPVIERLPESLPQSIIIKENLVSRSSALSYLHFPDNISDLSSAKERLAFEEIFSLVLASRLNRVENAKLTGWKIPFHKPAAVKFVKNLPFELTPSQKRASWDILQDLEKATPMNRLLQGDVGSGKTVVAGLVASQVAHQGLQTAIMAPTEILATQHAKTLAELLSPFGITVGLLTGSVKGKARQQLLTQIANGSCSVVIGTHALIQKGVDFSALGFVVIDEQHRFGVEQRQELLKKSQHMPHLLSMTATPIPRSLALTVYGELDISVINEKPKDRLPIITKIFSPNSVDKMYESIENEIANGHQAYVICSLIEDNPENDQKSVKLEYDKLRSARFKHRNIGLMHGKLKPAEKDEVMNNFLAGKIDILVSTTVVEVGVNVPNATIIVIENADRFGLAQLHQLRGRVGRSQLQSYCYLVNSSSAKPTQRLRELEKSNDGFYLAEVDLKLRGPGEVYGRAQHGDLNLQIATLADSRLISRVQKRADEFIQSGESLLKFKELAKQVQYYQRLTTLN